MSNGSDREDAMPPVSESPPTEASHDAQPPSSDGDDDKLKRRSTVSLKGPQSLERLRDRVKKVAHELERLRIENAALTERIRRLETSPAVDLEGTVLAFEEDPDILREKVESFINAIDTFLTKEAE